MTNEVILDASFMVAELDAGDFFHKQAVQIRLQIEREKLRPILLDAVVNEVVTVIGKRLERTGNQNQAAEIFKFLDRLSSPENIFFSYLRIQSYWKAILSLVKSSSGALSFHDSLILIVMKEFGFRKIATFDKDFDHVEGIEVLK